MFSEDERLHLRTDLVAAAEADGLVTAAALVGSAARECEDRWSDIDLALCLAPSAHPADVADEWTGRMYASHEAAAHFDLWRGTTLYRVFLLRSTLQVDLSFWPADDFGPVGGPFRLLFGGANPAVPSEPQDSLTSINMAWLYALHARSSIARGRAHQALYMLNGMRDHIVSLTCLRAGLPANQGGGVDDLSSGERQSLAGTLVLNLDQAELARAFRQLTDLLLAEAAAVAPQTAQELAPVLSELVSSATDHHS